jgi:hypothetical protein
MFEVLIAMLLGCNAESLSDSTNNLVAFFLNDKQFMINSQYFVAMAVLHDCYTFTMKVIGSFIKSDTNIPVTHHHIQKG